VADVAAHLRVAREKAGLSIEDLSVRTKIKPSILLSIEQGAFEQILGGEFFTRAFLRTYAREVHVPTAEMMGDYDSTRPGPVVVEAPPASRHHRLDSLRSAGVGWSLAVVIVAALLVRFAATRPAPTPDVERQSRGNDGKRRPGRAGRSRRHHWISSARTPHRGDPPHPPALG
jgi:cytoskeletal protein RodZ